MAILHSHRNLLIVVEHARVHVEDGRVVEARADSGRTLSWNIPHANIACLLLGQGSSLSQEAARLLAQERVLVGFSGTGGLPVFLASLDEYRPTSRAQEWMRRWSDHTWRLQAAQLLHQRRLEHVRKSLERRKLPPCPAISTFAQAIPIASDINSLRGFEANFAKALYAHVAQAFHIPWRGRIRSRDNPDTTPDLPNRRLDAANYLAYGAGAAALWIIGIPFFLPVQHGASRAGGLVFDAADLLKDAICLPEAFRTLHLPWPQAREEIIRSLQQINAIAEIISWIDEAIALP